MPYIKTTCKAGKTKEYEFYYSYRFDQKGGSRKKKENRTPEAQRQVNRRMAEKKLTRLMNANLSGEDYYLTLSYRKEKRPDRETLNRDIRDKNFHHIYLLYGEEKTAEDLPETRKRTEIHMDGGKRGEGSCTPSYCCQWDRSYITHHKRSMGKGMDLY